RLNVPNDWKIQPEKQNVSLAKSGETQTYWFEVFPPKNQSETVLIPELKVGNEIFDKELIEINYSHIPEQKVLLSGGSKIVHIDSQKKGDKIGYIMGAGDSVPESLKQIGYEVELIAPAAISAETLNKY